MAEGLSVAALGLFPGPCAPASESEASNDDALWSVSAYAGIVVSGSWTATSSAWETCRGENLVFSKYMFSVKKKMTSAGRRSTHPVSAANLEPECDCRPGTPSTIIGASISIDKSYVVTNTWIRIGQKKNNNFLPLTAVFIFTDYKRHFKP